MVVSGSMGPATGTPTGTRVSSTRTGVMPTKLPGAVGAAVAVAAGPRTFYVDRYLGAVVGEASRGGVRISAA